MQWRGFLDAQRRALERFAAATEDAPTVFVLGLGGRASAASSSTAAAVVHRGRDPRLRAEGEAADLQRLLRGRAPSRAAAPGWPSTPTACRSATIVFAFDFGTLAVEVCEDAWSPDGPMRRRCYSGAEIVVNVSASPFRDGRRLRPAARCSPRARPTTRRCSLYANAVGGQDGLDLRRRRLRLPERPPHARGAALPRGLAVGGGRSRSHAPPAQREHDLARATARRFRAERGRRAGAALRPARPPTARRLAYPAPDGRQLLPAGRRRVRPATPRERAARRSLRGARARRAELLREDRRVPLARHRALRRPRLAC